MTPLTEALAARLARLAPLHLDIRDDSALHAGHAGARGGGHYSVTLVSAAFDGQSRVNRHRMVFEAAGDLMTHGIHALAVCARTPAEWSSQNPPAPSP